MSARLNIQLPSDRELFRAPQRSQLATLRVALVLSERALLNQHGAIHCSTMPAVGDSQPQSLARMLLVRVRELHTLVDAYEQLLACEHLQPEEDDEIDF